MAWMRMMGVESIAYHRQTVMGRADDHPGLARAYYASHGETPLEWGGSGARRLGLVDAVTDEQYDCVFGPGGFRDPTTGTRLATAKRPGIELVVSAHKSVALLGLIGFADEMHAILDAETEATLRVLDDWTRAYGGRRGRSQVRSATEGLVYARTRHATSRAGDPEPHDHVLIANVVEMLDERGGHKALDTAAIRDLLHGATILGRVAGARRAIELGFAIEPDAGASGRLGHWRIAGVPEAACRQFSKRSAEIDASMEARGLGSYQARQVAARDTRRRKRHEAITDLMPLWHAELAAAGTPATAIQGSVTEAARQRPTVLGPSEEDLDRLAAEALGPCGRLAEMKVFTRSDVIVTIGPTLYGHDPAVVERAVQRVLRHPNAIPLLGVPNARERAYAPACVIAVEAAIVRAMEAGASRSSAAAISTGRVQEEIWAKEASLGRPLTVGQSDAVIGVCTSGRAVEVVIGVAGAGKTTMLDVARAGFEAAGYRVIGTATSGQAARTLGREAKLSESRTVASLLWRLDHHRVTLDDRTVLIVDEAAMTDDPALLRLLTAAGTAGAKTILVGDHRQLGAIGPSGAIEGLAQRYPDAVHVLRQNVRQVDRDERSVLAHLRAGDVSRAVDWYVAHDRVRIGGTRSDVLGQMIDDWYADVQAGRRSDMYAWRRANVAELNRLARERWIADGRVSGPELEAPGGRRYAAGDCIVTLAPGPDGSLVTSERGVVATTDLVRGQLVLRMRDERLVHLPIGDAGADRLDHGYALTVHRSQGDTTDRAHRFADGGGRELAYVSMSRATERSTVHVVADDLGQAAADLAVDWSTDRRQRWAIDTGTPTTSVADAEDRAEVPSRLRAVIREARLQAELDAIVAVMPPDVTTELAGSRRRLAWLHQDRHHLERGTGGQFYTAEGQAGFDVATIEQKLAHAHHRAEDRRQPRSTRRAARREVSALEPRLEAAVERWQHLAGPRHAQLTIGIDELTEKVEALQAQHDRRTEWLARHPEALPRLDRLNRELGTLRPAVEAPAIGREALPRGVDRGMPGLELDL